MSVQPTVEDVIRTATIQLEATDAPVTMATHSTLMATRVKARNSYTSSQCMPWLRLSQP